MCIYGVYMCVLVEQEAIRDKELQKKDKQESLRSFTSIITMQRTVLWCGYQRSKLII